ncbi:MAG: hypothetical protein ACF8Q5_01370 [Phycisphaerales bacterium JB040]
MAHGPRPWTELDDDERALVRLRPIRLRTCMLIYYGSLILLVCCLCALGVFLVLGLPGWVTHSALVGVFCSWSGAIGAGAVALRSLGAGWLESIGLPAADFVLTPVVLGLMLCGGVFDSPSILHATIKSRVRGIREHLGAGEVTWSDDDSLRRLIQKWSDEVLRLGYCPKCRYEVADLPRCPECGLRTRRATRPKQLP